MTHLNDWRDQALCTGDDPERYFSHDPAEIAEAIRICHDCPVRLQCADDALAIRRNGLQLHGVWAGYLHGERPRKPGGTVTLNNGRKARLIECVDCQETRPHGARGRCKVCYNRWARGVA